MKVALEAALLVGLAGSAMGQMTGVSHPEDVPITTNLEVIQQPVSDQRTPESVLKPRTVGLVPTTAPALVVPSTNEDGRPLMAGAVTAAPRLTDDVKPGGAPDMDADVVTRVAGPANQLPVGTIVKVRIMQALSTRLTVAGQAFTAELIEPVLRDDRVLLPAGSSLAGRVTEVHGGKRITGAASMHLTTQTVTLPDGTVYPLHAQVVDTDLYKETRIDEEGTISRRDHKAETLGAMTLSTGSAAAAGAVFGGWPGALVGAAVGAGVSTVVWLKQDRQAELPAGTMVSFLLTAPLAFGMQ